MIQWYTLNYGKLTWAECWRFGKGSSKFLIVAQFKLSGHQLPGVAAREDSLTMKDEADLPTALRDALERGAAPLLAMDAGFRRVGDRLAPSIRQQVAGERILISTDGTIIGKAMAVLMPDGTAVSVVAFLSRRQDGTSVGVGNSAQTFDRTPGADGLHLAGASAAELLEAHRRQTMNASGSSALHVFERDEDILAFILASEQATADHRIRRGLYTEMGAT